MEQAEASVKARLGLSRFANNFANGRSKSRIVASALAHASISVIGRKTRS